MEIEYKLLPKTKQLKNNVDVTIDLYNLASELYGELNGIGIINRTKNVSQLGLVKVKKNLNKTRYDYIMLQLYFHQIIKNNLNIKLKYSYNSKILENDFGSENKYLEVQEKTTMADIIQILVIVYNIGHFYNTFTSTRAVSLFCNKDIDFKNSMLNNISEKRFRDVFNKLILEKDYHRLHLLNSIMILEKCDNNKYSIILAKEILYIYLTKDTLSDKSKLHYVFDVFQKVRNVSFIAYDLQIANTPLVIDICNKKSMDMFFEELLNNHNNSSFSVQLLESITKLLDDNVYNENSNAICYYNISKRMISKLRKLTDSDEYYKLFENKDSILNDNYIKKYDFENKEILKLTFSKEQNEPATKLLDSLDKINHTRVGYYDRYSGEKTILVAIKDKCEIKAEVSFKVMKTVISALHNMKDIDINDKKYLLTCKFFLFFYFNQNPLIFKPTISSETCIICVRGSKKRIKALDDLIKKSDVNDDTKHETEALKKIIEVDNKNDLCLLVPSSIVVYEKEQINIELCEFDGIAIYPNREENQVLFIEAKNTKKKQKKADKCLKDKFEKLEIKFESNNIKKVDKDAYIYFTI